LILPAFPPGLTHRQADAVFHATEWIVALELCYIGCW
jgi:hypothetical protein